MSILVLPMVILVTQEALKAVPNSYREASLALGTTKLADGTESGASQCDSGDIDGDYLVGVTGDWRSCPVDRCGGGRIGDVLAGQLG